MTSHGDGEATIKRHLDASNPGDRYATSVRYGDLIFVSGQIGLTEAEEAGDFEHQLRVALGRVIAGVEALGGSSTTLIKVTGYLADVADFPVYDGIYREMLANAPLPARTTVQVGAFPGEILVEMDAVATVLPSATPGRIT